MLLFISYPFFYLDFGNAENPRKFCEKHFEPENYDDWSKDIWFIDHQQPGYKL